MAAPRPIGHRRDETRNLLGVVWVICLGWNKDKSDPDCLPQRIQALGKEVLTRHLAIGDLTTLDVEKYKIDVGEVIIVCPVSEKPRRIISSAVRRLMRLAVANNPRVKPLCTSGAPPEMVHRPLRAAPV
jgi:hypothetical protein